MRFGLALCSVLSLATQFALAQDTATASAPAAATEAAAPAETAPPPAPVDPMAAVAAGLAELANSNPGDAGAGAGKSAVCGACHGLDGNATDPQYPKLAGQHEGYIARQLTLFKTGARPNPIMLPFASALSAQDMRDIGAHFAKSAATAGKADDSVIQNEYSPNNGKRVVAVGEALYRGGAKDRSIPACMACHGPSGRGIPGPTYPALTGQHSSYTVNVLNLFKATAPSDPALNDANYAIMAQIAARLTDEEILAVASYVQGLHTAAPGEHLEATKASAATQP